MKDITVGIKLELYLKEWLETPMGRPVRFPSKSYENALLHRFLVRGGPNRLVDDTVVLRGINWKFSKLKAACSSPWPVPRPAHITVLLARTSVASLCI